MDTNRKLLAWSQFSLRVLFVAILLAAIAIPIGLQIYRYLNPAPFFSGPTTSLCIMSGSDAITQRHVTNLLSQNGINSMTEGSKVYGTIVETSKLEKAKELLEQSSADNHVTISLDASNGLIWVKAVVQPELRFEIAKSFSDFDTEDRSEQTRLCLAIRDGASHTKLAPKKLPIVKSLSFRKREYMNSNGKYDIGYDVNIRLVDDLASPKAEYTENYQIMDDFKTVIGQGGYGTGEIPD